MKLLFFLLIFRLILAESNENDDSQLSSDKEKRLFDNIFKNYNKDILPPHNSTHPPVIYVGISALHLKSINFAEQTIGLEFWLHCEWSDLRLVWDRQKNNITRVGLDAKRIWRPDVTLLNRVDAKEIDITDRSNTRRAIVYFAGWVVWVPQQSVKVSCALDITSYPLDTHNCSFIVSSWRSDVDFKIYHDDNLPKVDLDDFWEILPEWEILDTYAKRTSDNYNVHLIFSLKIGRARPLYQTIILFPLAAGIILAITAFLISPFDSNRIAFNVFVLFIFIFTMLQLIEIFPSVGRHIPAVVSVCEALIVLITLCIAWNMILLVIFDYLEKTEISPFAQKFLSSRPIKLINRLNIDDTLQMDANEIKVNEQPEAILMDHSGWRNEWQAFLIVLDKLAFITFVFLVVVILFAICC